MKLSLAALSLAAFALVSAAQAAESRLSDCTTMQKQVAAALEAAQPGDSTEQARVQASAARSFCGSGLYTKGVARYAQALHLLGHG